MKSRFISQLPDKVEDEIKSEVKWVLYKNGLREEELECAIEAAMNSRIGDLEDTINIKKYLS